MTTWGHIEKVERDGKLMGAKIAVYAGTSDEYATFATPERYHALEEYIDFRKSHGERIGNDSPAIRESI